MTVYPQRERTERERRLQRLQNIAIILIAIGAAILVYLAVATTR